jgi:RNA polymerase sigma-70 factor (sigma-E family)
MRLSRELDAEFEAFVVRSSTALMRTAYLLAGDRGHAEDMLQTALLRTVRQWGRARGAPEAYTRQVLVNLARDRWRTLRRRPEHATATLESAGSDDSEALDDRDLLLRAVRQLPAKQRVVIVLRYWEELTIAETAAALGCSEGNVKSATSRGLSRLRELMSTSNQEEALC